MPSSKVLKSVAEVVTEAIKKADAEKAVGKTKEILESQTPPATTPRGGPLLPRSQGMYPPDVPQVDLPRQKGVDKARAEGKKPKYTERMQSLLDSPTVRKKVDKLIAKGQDLGMKEWYGTEPLRQAALDVISPQQYESLMAQLASASQRNPVDQQNLMGSYLYYLQQQGRLDPDALLLTNKLKEQGIEGIEAPLIELPEGYGSLAQSAIFNRGKQIAAGDIEGALPPEKKLGTFYRNLLGNLQPVTVDVNAVRGPVIEAGDPRWLTSKLVEKDEAGKVKNVYFPRQMVEEGKMSVREAKERPGFWEAAPSGSEYAGFEDLWQRAARREGVRPAEAQALGWYGSGDVTALKTKPELYIENLERLLSRTADVTGKSPLEVLRQFLKGEEFLRKAEGGSIDLEAEYQMGRAGGGFVRKAMKAIQKAAESADVKMTPAVKDLTTMEDAHTGLMDSVREKSGQMRKVMEGLEYKYKPGEHVFTESKSKKPLPPWKIVDRQLSGNMVMREPVPPGTPVLMGKIVRDPETGKPLRTPYEPGYKVRREYGPDDWEETIISESGILGRLDPDEPYAKGGAVMMADGGELEEEYNLRKMGMDPTRVRGGYERKPLSRAEIQAMMLDVPAGIGVPFAEAGSYALRGKTDEAKESAAIEAALIGVPGAAVLAKPAYRAVKKGVQKAAPAVREAAREALESGMESGAIIDPRMQAIAYHGTPHKFEKFDPSKIGTGEGAQAYGHGLYFAESPETAQGYATTLANRDASNQMRLNAHANAQRLAKLAGPENAADDIKYALSIDPNHPQKKLLSETLELLESGRYELPLESKGHLYTVDIPDESIARMLDWDKPLGEQPEAVQKALSKADIAGNASYFVQNPNEGTLGEMYRSLANQHGAPAVSEFLKSQGIPGIKYLDASSRSAGEGTRNFVVFPGEEESVKIFERKKKGGAVEGYAKGGEVRMADGGDPESPTLREMGQPRYSTERKGTNAFKFTKDVLENLYQMAKMQAAEELKTTDPRAITDVANNIIADTVGAPVDMVNMAMQSFGVGSERPVGGSQQLRDLMREYEMTSGVERPLTETLLSIAGPGAVAKGPRAAERALNVGTAAVRRPFTPVTVTTEAVAPDLAKTQDEAFKQYVTKQLLGEGDVKTLGGRPVTQRPGQGVYYNEAGQLELNPMVGLDVPVRGSLAKAEKFKGDVATLGAGLGQEAMAAHRFIPMATNQIKDATAMLIKGPEGKSLTREQVIELGQDLPGMIVTHSPRLGGVMVAPFSITKGVIPPEFLEAQSRAKKLFGKGVTIQYGRADPGKDLMYMSRDEYAMSGAREPSVEMQRKRAQLKRMEQSLPAGRRSAVATQSQSPAVLDKTD